MAYDPKNNPQPIIHFHVGASAIRNAMMALEGGPARCQFLRIIWPDMPMRMAELICTYPEETRVSGSVLSVPPSWLEIISAEHGPAPTKRRKTNGPQDEAGGAKGRARGSRPRGG